jgi:hypothetical protein
MSSDHRLRHQHEDARNEAALRMRVLADHDRTVKRLLGVLVQHPGRAFHECPVAPVSPRRPWGWPDAPGCVDSTGFSDGLV